MTNCQFFLFVCFFNMTTVFTHILMYMYIYIHVYIYTYHVFTCICIPMCLLGPVPSTLLLRVMYIKCIYWMFVHEVVVLYFIQLQNHRRATHLGVHFRCDDGRPAVSRSCPLDTNDAQAMSKLAWSALCKSGKNGNDIISSW